MQLTQKSDRVWCTLMPRFPPATDTLRLLPKIDVSIASNHHHCRSNSPTFLCATPASLFESNLRQDLSHKLSFLSTCRPSIHKTTFHSTIASHTDIALWILSPAYIIFSHDSPQLIFFNDNRPQRYLPPSKHPKLNDQLNRKVKILPYIMNLIVQLILLCRQKVELML